MVIVKSHAAACHAGNWEDTVKSWRTSSVCVRSQCIQRFSFGGFLFLFLFLFNNRKPARDEGLNTRRQTVDVISLLSHTLQRQPAWMALHPDKRYRHSKTQPWQNQRCKYKQAHWPTYTYANTQPFLLLLTPPPLALPRPLPHPGHRAVRVWESYF